MYKYDNLVTILETNNEQHKTWTLNENYEFILQEKRFSKWYDFKEVAVNDLYDLYALLESCQNNPHQSVVRGKINEKAWKHKLDGYKITRSKDFIEDYPKRWIMFDIDNFLKPESVDITRSKGRKESIEIFLESLGSQFKETSYICQFSNGMFPTSEKIKAHLWFMLDKPAKCQELKEYFTKDKYNLDTCVFNAPQIYYTSKPKFTNCLDPLSESRLYLIEKKNNLLKL